MEMIQSLGISAVIFLVIVIIGIISLIIKTYRKATQGQAMVRTGAGGAKVTFTGMFVIPILHKMESMDITLKTVVIERMAKDGLICKDNMRADIKVAFFVRVNKTSEDVIQVAQSIGCNRASDQKALVELFDAKFSEALKTVGKQFEFVELYNSREKFKHEILNIIGTDLNGYILDDCAIDFLEQTPLESLSENNILDSEGIKKIVELTAKQKVLSNQIERNKQKTITKQDVEARETVLELERQLAETEENQKREVANIKDRQEAEIKKVAEEQRLVAEKARIIAEEEIAVAEKNKERQVVIADKNRERVEAVETEAVEQERELKHTERERIVTLAQIEKQKEVEIQKKQIQEVIRERVEVEKATVAEQEKIKDTQDFATADRAKKVAITKAEMDAEEAFVREIKSAEAAKNAAEHNAKTRLIDAEAEFEAAGKRAEASKIMAEAKAAEEAAIGVAEAQVIEAKADAMEKQGLNEAKVMEMKSEAEAKGKKAKAAAEAESIQKVGESEAEVIKAKAEAHAEKGQAENKVLDERNAVEAKGIEEKGMAMKKLDAVGRDHEEFKLKLDMQKELELARINIQKGIADAQSQVIAEALKAANIDIVGGETMFFDKIIGSITQGKQVDKLVKNSDIISDIKNHFFDSSDGKSFKGQFASFIDQFGISSEDVRNLSISALIGRMMQENTDEKTGSMLSSLNDIAKSLGVSNSTAKALGIV
ncbi:flotillin family protein [Carboxylicivirga sp. M1479]|uniref:flotillin family protein n=2 Tax=Carboxylicivirga TaxID=1628153 RepID=UPI001177F9CB|nr:flotillin family protein [Carboxylicivirga sp. M1479]TRX71204.1 flotillin family protein [Carboxylicivirga sp. M1479]